MESIAIDDRVGTLLAGLSDGQAVEFTIGDRYVQSFQLARIDHRIMCRSWGPQRIGDEIDRWRWSTWSAYIGDWMSARGRIVSGREMDSDPSHRDRADSAP